ncbi:UNVERIFIED_CONTAM: hypothetical protein FKN15_050748 [Acipenser sinensis]
MAQILEYLSRQQTPPCTCLSSTTSACPRADSGFTGGRSRYLTAGCGDEESFLWGETQDPDLIQTSTDFDPPAFSDVPGLSGGGQNWLNPASAPSVSKSAVTLASMEGAEAIELAQFPPVDSTIVALVPVPPVGGLCKDPVCHNGHCRIMDAHLKKAYAAEVQVSCLANTGGFLMAYLDGMLHSVALPEPLASELCTVLGTLLQISGFQGQALGRSLAGLMVVRCQLWPSQGLAEFEEKTIAELSERLVLQQFSLTLRSPVCFFSSTLHTMSPPSDGHTISTRLKGVPCQNHHFA